MSQSGKKGGLSNDCFALADQSGLNRDGLPDFLPIEAAWGLIERQVSRVAETEELPLAGALGRVSAGSVSAQYTLPPLANAAVDGYAFDGSSGTLERNVEVTVHAGDPAPEALMQNSCARVLTGALLPPNVDRVAMEEDCIELAGGKVRLPELKAGSNRRPAGENVALGDQMLTANQVIRPQELALATAFGAASVTVRRKVRVTVFSTGEELVESEPAPHQAVDVNGPMLRALLADPAVELIWGGILADDDATVRAALTAAAKTSDAIITSGGASMSEADSLRRVLATEGSAHIWRLAIKPGRPLLMGSLADCPVVALPGNPVAAYATGVLIARPVLRALAGSARVRPTVTLVEAGFDRKSKVGRAEFLRVRVDGRGAATVYHRDGAGIIPSLHFADGLAWLDADAPSVARGELLRFISG